MWWRVPTPPLIRSSLLRALRFDWRGLEHRRRTRHCARNRRRHRSAVGVRLLAMCRDIEALGFLRLRRAQRHDETDQLENDKRRHAAVDDGGEDGGTLNQQLPRVA